MWDEVLGPKWLPRHSRIARGIVFVSCWLLVGVIGAGIMWLLNGHGA